MTTTKIDFRDGKEELEITLAGSLRSDDHPGWRNELLLWAVVDRLDTLITKTERAALAGHDQAAAVREQTARMQQNMEEARAKSPTVEQVLAMVVNKFPTIVQKLAEASGASPDQLKKILFAEPTITGPNGGG